MRIATHREADQAIDAAAADTAADPARPNCAPPGAVDDLPAGFMEFLEPLHRALTPRQRLLVERRGQRLDAAHAGQRPDHPPRATTVRGEWRITLPEWCLDQRNQMTGPADDAALVVKMLNSGAPGVMLDLEDSMANRWPNLMAGAANILAALEGTLEYDDPRRGRRVGIEPSSTVIFTRPRGLHLSQGGVIPGELVAAPLFDAALISFQVDPARLRHPLCFYIPKSESAEEGTWWRDLFRGLAESLGWPPDSIRAMALVESHPLAYEVEPFISELREHLLGLNLGRWDYMASLIHYNLADPAWVLPDRNTIPHDVPFFQRLRELLVELCHRRGILALGGMTALYPSREDPQLNERALEVLERDKRNEAEVGMDGAWTGHPDQNEIAVAQFARPNQLGVRHPDAAQHPDLRPVPAGIGRHTLRGSRDAVRTVIRYRAGVLEGKGASLLDGYMEDLATDRIYRLMLAQRVRHRDEVVIRDESDQPVPHTPELLTQLFDEELARILVDHEAGRLGAGAASPIAYRTARVMSEEMIAAGRFDPV